jgi:hypothetical protein
VEVDGAAVPLYTSRDHPDRLYLEARKGAAYSIRLANRSHERVAVAVTVDGLNVISAQRETLAPAGVAARPGRMYVLDPWSDTVIRGWRTTREEVRRFTFVDEQRSYATRSGKANAQMGWIEVAAYRERHPRPAPVVRAPRESDGDREAAGAPAARDEAKSKAEPAAPGARAQGFPGTGWGDRTADPVVVVDFEPQAYAAERVTLRYEYASGLRALGIFPTPRHADRLQQRERGDGGGFAPPPRW